MVVLFANGEGDIGFRLGIKLKNLTCLAILLDSQQSLAIGIGNFPAGLLRIKVGGTVLINVFRTIEHPPARFFAFPEA